MATPHLALPDGDAEQRKRRPQRALLHRIRLPSPTGSLPRSSQTARHSLRHAVWRAPKDTAPHASPSTHPCTRDTEDFAVPPILPLARCTWWPQRMPYTSGIRRAVWRTQAKNTLLPPHISPRHTAASTARARGSLARTRYRRDRRRSTHGSPGCCCCCCLASTKHQSFVACCDLPSLSLSAFARRTHDSAHLGGRRRPHAIRDRVPTTAYALSLAPGP